MVAVQIEKKTDTSVDVLSAIEEVKKRLESCKYVLEQVDVWKRKSSTIGSVFDSMNLKLVGGVCLCVCCFVCF